MAIWVDFLLIRSFLSSDPSLDSVLQNFRSAGCPLLQTETVGLRENML